MARKTNCKKNNSNYYRISRTIGHKPDGKPIRKDFYGSGINEATEKANKYMQNLKMGLVQSKKTTTINTLLPTWLFDIKKNELKPRSFDNYEIMYRVHIKDDIISNLSLDEIKSLNIQQFYNRLKESNRTVGTIKQVHRLLHVFFEYCVKEGYVIKNPCNNVTLPKLHQDVSEILKEKARIDFFTEEEIPILIDLFEGSKYKDIVIFALATRNARIRNFRLAMGRLRL